ncbi:MAG: hypothetical protein BWZ06_01957 [Bacteroidetes bacterium ADurb.BinA261]|nr:MAG: hypothetical protein BWZ06_01957 [Bacteroidetes bacterium ADurb.BinA261]
MSGNTVDNTRIDHQRQSTAIDNGCTERLEKLSAQVALGYYRRSTVLPGNGNTVTHVMLDAGCNPIFADTVSVFSLKSTHGSNCHRGIQISVFAITFPLTRPSRIATQVHGRIKCPGNIAGTRFVSRNLRTFFNQLRIERGSHSYFLWKKRSSGRISCSMIGIDAVKHRNTGFLNCFLLYIGDNVFPNFRCASPIVTRVQNRSYLIFTENRIHHGRIEFERFVTCI